MVTNAAAPDMIAGGGASMTANRQSPKSEARKEREERLAAELRENLRKRKAQMRARKNASSKPADEDR
jgi:hypothetical protein